MSAIIVIFSVAGLLWGTLLVARGDAIGACLAYLLAACCFGHAFVNFDLGPVPLTIDRLVFVLLVAIFVVQYRRSRADLKPLDSAEWLMVALLSWFLVTMAVVDRAPDVENRTLTMVRLVAGYLMPFGMYAIARHSLITARKHALVLGSLACFGVYLALTAILEVACVWSLVFPRYIADPTVGLHFGRARGPMVQSVSLGLYLAVCLLALGLWRPRWGRVGELARVAIVPLLIAGIVLTYTRSVWMGTGAAVVIVLALSLKTRPRAVLLGAVAVGALLAATGLKDSLLGMYREGSATDARHSAELRGSLTYVSWLMFLDQPWMGVGFGEFPIAKLPYLSDRSSDLHLEAVRPYVHHNTFLSILTETGAIGLGLFLTMLAIWARRAWGLVRDPLAEPWARNQGLLLMGTLAAYFCQLLFHELSYTSIDHSLVFFIAGMTGGIRADWASSRVTEPTVSNSPSACNWIRPRIRPSEHA